MRQLPSGNVTFLFTDIEGSTRLLHDLGDAYAGALAEHRRALREVFGRHGGVEVDTQGDAFFYAFGAAGEAVAAAAEGQAALEGGPVRVRMGLHTGTAEPSGEGYVGLDVHLGARIAAAGHGGQVLLSAGTRELVDASVLDLGEHRLKDFGEPLAIFQLGTARFPPLRTISNTNLPRPASAFVGRERERAEVVSLLRDGARLLTLTGPGGSGKTRLAIEAAAELVSETKGGVFWVGLAALRDPSLVPATLARVLGSRNGLADHIDERELLLLLDNFEQVVEAAPELASLVEVCPNLRLLVTSRELLRVRGEVEFAVFPLADVDAAELFCARARVDPEEAVDELCRRLDNLPLAIELAAARANVLSPRQLVERLGDRLDLLRGGRDAEARQQTLRATIAWSHDLLEGDERRVFADLAVFAGGCTLASAEAVVGTALDTLQSLVDKSLVRWADERFWMLDTIHEFALLELEKAGRREHLAASHAEHFFDFAERAEATLREGQESRWLASLESEHDNLRAALEFFSGSPMQLRLATLLWRFWLDHGYLSEGRAWLEAALTDREDVSAGDLSRALQGAAALARVQGDFDEASELAEESLVAARRAGDPALESRALGTLANVYMTCGEYRRAADLHGQAEAIFRRLGDDRMLATAACNRAYLTLEVGDHEPALGLAREAVDLSRKVGDRSNTLSSLLNVALAAMALGEDSEARLATRDAVVQALELGHKEYLAVAVIATAALLAPTRPATSAELLRAATRARDELRLTLGPVERGVLESTEATLRGAPAESEPTVQADTVPQLSLEEAGELAAAELIALVD